MILHLLTFSYALLTITSNILDVSLTIKVKHNKRLFEAKSLIKRKITGWVASLHLMPDVNFSQISNLIFGFIVHLEVIIIPAHKTTSGLSNQIKVKSCYFLACFRPCTQAPATPSFGKCLYFAF